MKNKVLTFFSTMATALTIYMLINPAGLAASDIRGLPLDTGVASEEAFVWNATTFGGFCYPVNKHLSFVNQTTGWGEKLYYQEKTGSEHGALGKGNPENHILDEKELIYTTKQYPTKQKVASSLGLNDTALDAKLGAGNSKYYQLAWFGTPYIAVENDATQLSKLVLKQGGSDRKELKVGETWVLGKGYNLTVNQVSVENNKVWFSLYKDGKELESAIIDTDGPVENKIFVARADFGNAADQLYFITYVDSVFRGSADSLAVFKYTWLTDRDNLLLLKAGDEFHKFKVESAAKDHITLSNKNSIDIEVDSDKKTYFTDSWYFQTSDSGSGTAGGYIIYPGCEVKVQAPAAPAETGLTQASKTEPGKMENRTIESKEIPEKSRPVADENLVKTEAAGADSGNKAENKTKAADFSGEKSPGFGAAPALSGIFAVLLLAGRIGKN